MYGEGLTRSKQGDHTEYKVQKMTEKDIRFTSKGNAIYAMVMDWPTEDILIKSFSTDLTTVADPIQEITLLGSTEKIKWNRTEKGLRIEAPKTKVGDYAFAFKIELQKAPDGIYRGNKN